jgi:hypothetical protein
MLVKRDEVLNEDGSIGFIESVFKSENILKITYFVDAQRLYISFSRGDTYVYENVSPEFYKEFEGAESNGKFFYRNLNKNKKYPTKRVFGLKPYEIEGFKEIVENFKPDDEDD